MIRIILISLFLFCANAEANRIDVVGGGGGSGSVSDTVYGAGWDGDTTVAPSKNAVYDKIETIASGGDNITVNTTAATNANLLDNLYIDWAIDTVATPDDITAKFNYAETLAGNPALLTGECILTIDGVICEGTTADAIEIKLAFPDPATTDKTVTLPNATDTLVGKDTNDTLTNKTMAAASNVLDADTAVALAANGANCAASSFPLGVDASGAVESCSTSISGNAATATALAADPADCGANTFATTIAASGALTCATPALGTDTSGNYVATVADGTGIDGTASGEGTTYTPTFDATELEALTWGAGGNASNIWTFNLSGTDPTITFNSGAVAIGGALSATGAVTGSNLSGTNTGDNTVATSGDSATSFFSSGTLEVAIGGTGTTTSTGTGAVVLGTSPTFTTSITATNLIVDAHLATTESINLPVYSAKLTGAFVVFTPPTADACTQGAQIDAGDGNWRLLFDATTDECATWQFVLPDYWAAHSELKILYSMSSATANEVDFEAAVMCVTPTDAADVGTAGFANVATASDTVPGTAGYPDSVSITITDDSCAAGDIMFVVISKDADDATLDDATGDTEIVGVVYEFTR